MFTGTFQATQDRWSDAQEGTPLALSRWLEQVTEEPEHGGLFSRLPQRGQVPGWGPEVLYVRFAGEGQLISMSPQLVRLLPDEPGGHWW